MIGVHRRLGAAARRGADDCAVAWACAGGAGHGDDSYPMGAGVDCPHALGWPAFRNTDTSLPGRSQAEMGSLWFGKRISDTKRTSTPQDANGSLMGKGEQSWFDLASAVSEGPTVNGGYRTPGPTDLISVVRQHQQQAHAAFRLLKG